MNHSARMQNISMQKVCIASVKVALLCFCIFACTDASVNPKQKEKPRLYGDMEYLYFTNISLYVTILASATGIIHRLTDRLKRHFEILTSVSPVCNSATTVTFWGLYFTKRTWIKAADDLRPGCETWLITELSQHLFPLILSYLEQMDMKLTPSRWYYLLFICIIVTWGTVVHIVAYYKGKFLYGFLDACNPVDRIFFFVGVFGFCILFYHILMVVNRRCTKYIK